jgi:hypothetical protein
MYSYKKSNCLFKDTEHLEIWMRSAIQEYRDSMKCDERCKVQRIIAASCQVAIQLIVDTVAQISLLEERALCGMRLPLREECRQCCYEIIS